jgi:hypothetical protein
MKYAINVITDKGNAALLAEEFQLTETKNDYLKYLSK